MQTTFKGFYVMQFYEDNGIVMYSYYAITDINYSVFLYYIRIHMLIILFTRVKCAFVPFYLVLTLPSSVLHVDIFMY